MQKLRRHYIDAQGGVIFDPLHNRDVASGNGAPTNGVAGYNPGCLYEDQTNGRVYVNVGTLASSSWSIVGTTGALNRNVVNTNDATVGAATLTPAEIIGGVITRSASVANYTDTTDTAANIIAALPAGTPVGSSWFLTILNTTKFNETIAGGTGVTVSGVSIVLPNSMGTFLVTYATATTVTMYGLNSDALTIQPLLVSTNLTTVGAGTITAAGIAGGVTNRTGSTAAFTDTTDTAANIIAALPNANIGQSFLYTYFNNTLGVATLAGGTGVTLSGTGQLVPVGCWAEYLVTFTAAATVTIQGIATGPIAALPNTQQVSNATAGVTTAAVGDCSGANWCNLILTAVGAANYTFRTATQMFGDIPNCVIGFTYMLAIRNTNAGTTTVVAPDGNTTLTGTATIAQNVTRLFSVKFTSATQMTITSMGILAAGA